MRLTLNLHREGKTTLLNRMVPTAQGEIVLFSDASTLFAPDAVRCHVAHYADHRSAVSGVTWSLSIPHAHQ